MLTSNVSPSSLWIQNSTLSSSRWCIRFGNVWVYNWSVIIFYFFLILAENNRGIDSLFEQSGECWCNQHFPLRVTFALYTRHSLTHLSDMESYAWWTVMLCDQRNHSISSLMVIMHSIEDSPSILLGYDQFFKFLFMLYGFSVQCTSRRKCDIEENMHFRYLCWTHKCSTWNAYSHESLTRWVESLHYRC